MIKYHGTPFTPISAFMKHLKGKNVLVSWFRPDDVNRSFCNCNKVILDNGAYSFWKKKQKVNWAEYYEWVGKFHNREFFIIPDVIDGTEEENDNLLISNPFNDGVPVWHVAESYNRLQRLVDNYTYIAIGSSGDFSTLGTNKWHRRLHKAMKVICDEKGKPKVKIHMLRCLNHKIFTKYPFYSGDSTNVARNHKEKGAFYIMNNMEKYNSPLTYEAINLTLSPFLKSRTTK